MDIKWIEEKITKGVRGLVYQKRCVYSKYTMIINRIWQMPNKNTFEIKPIKSLIDKYSFGKIVDPFANNNKIANVTNDLEQKEQIGRIVKKDGIVISCGWNSGGIGKKYGFEIQEILLVPHGGAHNDTIVVVDKKIK